MVGKINPRQVRKKKKIRRFKVPEVTLTHRKMAPLRILPRCCGKVKKPHSWGLGKWLQTFSWWVPWWFHGPWDFSEPVRSTDVFFFRYVDLIDPILLQIIYHLINESTEMPEALNYTTLKKGRKKPTFDKPLLYIYIPKTKNPIASMAATSNKMAAQLFRLAGAWIQSRDGKKRREATQLIISPGNLWTFFRLKGWGENSGTIECWIEMRHIFSNPSSHNHGSVKNDGKWVYLQYLFPFI